MTDPFRSALDRRRFIAASAAGAAFAAVPFAGAVGRTVRREDELRIGVIGCGGRGTGAAVNALEASPDARLVALGDVFADRLRGSRGNLAGATERFGDRCVVSEDQCFSGFDAFQKVLETDCDLVILATPPGFRPQHFEAAVAAGKHVFMEKPVAVDATGVRTVIAAAERAAKNRQSVVAGTQRRHEQVYLEAMDRLGEGAIGDLRSARCYWNMGGLWSVAPKADRSDMENQLRNWLYYTWLSGDHIVEQHVHNIDVVNWAFGATPSAVFGVGGRQARTDPRFGHIFDHFCLEFEYPDDRWAMSMCRQQDNTFGRVDERLTGTSGTAILSSNFAQFNGSSDWRWASKQTNPYVQEHIDLQASVRGSGPYLNEGRRIAESTLCAIMGRESAYTGKRITWEEAMNAKLDLRPSSFALGEMPSFDVAVPGVTEPDRPFA